MRGARHHDPTPKPHPETPNLACANREGKVGACACDVAESLACVSDVGMCK